jgi:cytochrome P450
MPDSVLPSKIPVNVPLVNEPWGLFKSLSVARKNLLRILPEVATKQPIVSGKTGKRWHMLMEPTAMREILLDRVGDYPKSDVTKNLLKPAIGESLFIAEGAHWRWQRRAAAPVFTHRNMMNLAPIMTSAAERSAQRITDAGPRGINMLDEMVTTTFDIIADVTFSGGDTFDRDGVHNAIDDYIAEAGKISLFDILGAPDWVPRPGRIRSGKAVERNEIDGRQGNR